MVHAPSVAADVSARAAASAGTSARAIYRAVTSGLARRNAATGVLIDVGCGTGALLSTLGTTFTRRIGVDAVRYSGFPESAEFLATDLDGGVPLPDQCGDVVVSVETIEHLNHPRHYFAELARIVQPGGWLVVSTPNQTSLLSIVTLLTKSRFSAFQDVHYPVHRSALLPVDLERMARECGLTDLAIEWSLEGRVVLTARHFPRWVSRRWPRLASDNVLLFARRPDPGVRLPHDDGAVRDR